MADQTTGRISGIFIAAAAAEPMQSLESVDAMAGSGLVGDRYANGTGFYSANPTTPGAREVTLIEDEVLTAVMAEIGITILVGETRRNLTTTGIALETLLGRRFSVGNVVMEGVRRCPPCVHLEELTGKPLLRPLARQGGLRARVVASGRIAIGDAVQDLGEAIGQVDLEKE